VVLLDKTGLSSLGMQSVGLLFQRQSETRPFLLPCRPRDPGPGQDLPQNLISGVGPALVHAEL